MIEADFPRDESTEQDIKIMEVKEGDKDNTSVRSEVPRALSILEQEVRRSGRSVCETISYNPTTGTGKATELSSVKIIILVWQNWIIRN